MADLPRLDLCYRPGPGTIGNAFESGYGAGDFIVFDLYIGTEHVARMAEERAEIIGPSPDGSTSSPGRLSDLTFELPRRIGLNLKQLLAQVDPKHPLLLRFETPFGVLPLAPWEQLLSSQIERRVLREASARVSAPAHAGRDLALAFSPPETSPYAQPDWLAGFLRALPASAMSGRCIHVFLTAEDHARQELRHDDLSFAVKLHGPSARPAGAGVLVNPWLVAMADTLGGGSVGSVAFVARGGLGRNNGVLVVQPLDLQSGKSVNIDRDCLAAARQLDVFLESVGAQSVAFFDAGPNASTYGLRRLQFELAAIRARRVLLDDGTDLAAAKWLALADGEREHDFGGATVFAPADWLVESSRTAIGENLARMLGNTGTSLSDRVVGARDKAASLVQNFGSWLADQLPHSEERKKIEEQINKMVESLRQLDVDPKLIEAYQKTAERMISNASSTAASILDQAVRAGQSRAKAWLDEQTARHGESK